MGPMVPSGLIFWRAKIRSQVGQAVTRLKEKFDMPTTAVMYAALAFAEAQGADLRAIVEGEFGQAPKRALPWHMRAKRTLDEKKRVREANAATDASLGDAS